MNRTAIVAALALVAAAAVAGVGYVMTRPPPKPPNVLIILWDTTRADRMSLYGYELGTTPRMKAWAEENGVVFERAISPDMWTVPSHASLFTGLPPGTHGAGFDHRWLDNERTTLAEWFGEKGWDTFAFSANPNLSPNRVNLLQGFQAVETSWSRKWRNAVIAHTKDKLIRRDMSTEISPGSKSRHAGTGFYNAAPIAHDSFVGWLDTREHPEKPFFVYLSYMEAHKPRVPTLDSRRVVADDETIGLGLATDLSFKNQLLYGYGKKSYTPEELVAINRVYDAALRDLDDATADLLDDLKARKILDDTIVVFTADHGEQLGEHQQFGHRSGVYQQLLHVPLVIAYPRKVAARRVSAPVSNLELFDTIVELSGIEDPAVGQVKGNLANATEAIRGVFSETLSIDRLGFTKVKKMYPDLGRDVWANTYRSIVKGNWKLIESVSFDTNHVLNCELYDLDPDPGEDQNVFDQQPEKAEELISELEGWKKVQVPWDAKAADTVSEHLSEAEKHQLELLGYLSEEDGDEPAPAEAPVDESTLPGNRCKVVKAQ
ncbi:MAG: sulfatase-like hydrolase/transferase [Myxococcota bacterium]